MEDRKRDEAINFATLHCFLIRRIACAFAIDRERSKRLQTKVAENGVV